MAETYHDEKEEDGRSPRGLLVWASISAIGSLVILGGILYAALWLPFRQPGDSLPRRIELLPLEYEPRVEAAPADAETTYTWVDREAGIVGIPIEQAMRVVSETLPVTDGAAAAAKQRQRGMIPTDAGSGRFVTRGDEESTPASAREDSGE